MAVRVITPSADLASVVRAFVHAETGAAHAQVLLPEGGVVMALRFGGTAAFTDGPALQPVPQLSLTGLTTVARRVQVSAHGGVVLALFHALGAARICAVPLHDIYGFTLPLVDVIRRDRLDHLQEELAAAATIDVRIALVEAFLRERLLPASTDALIATAVQSIVQQPGRMRIAPLARRLCLSQDRFEKRFRQAVGASPKQYASIVRFRRVLALRRGGMSLAALAQALGYCDQSHLARDFRNVTGCSVGEFERTPAQCVPAPRPTGETVRIGSLVSP